MNELNRSEQLKQTLGRNAYMARKVIGYNHEKLVEISGLTRPILSSIENGTANPTFESLIKLSNSFNISLTLLLMTKNQFNHLKKMLTSVFLNVRGTEYNFIISEKTWKLLLMITDFGNKREMTKIAKLCKEIIEMNFPKIEHYERGNILLGASLGVIFQDDGFKNGLEFGAWLGRNYNNF